MTKIFFSSFFINILFHFLLLFLFIFLFLFSSSSFKQWGERQTCLVYWHDSLWNHWRSAHHTSLAVFCHQRPGRWGGSVVPVSRKEVCAFEFLAHFHVHFRSRGKWHFCHWHDGKRNGLVMASVEVHFVCVCVCVCVVKLTREREKSVWRRWRKKQNKTKQNKQTNKHKNKRWSSSSCLTSRNVVCIKVISLQKNPAIFFGFGSWRGRDGDPCWLADLLTCWIQNISLDSRLSQQCAQRDHVTLAAGESMGRLGLRSRSNGTTGHGGAGGKRNEIKKKEFDVGGKHKWLKGGGLSIPEMDIFFHPILWSLFNNTRSCGSQSKWTFPPSFLLLLVEVLVVKAQENFGIPQREVKLLRNGQTLEPSCTIQQAGLGDFDVIIICQQKSSWWRLSSSSLENLLKRKLSRCPMEWTKFWKSTATWKSIQWFLYWGALRNFLWCSTRKGHFGTALTWRTPKNSAAVWKDEKILEACKRYTGQDYMGLNLCLNLLHRPTEESFMTMLILICLHSRMPNPQTESIAFATSMPKSLRFTRRK